MKKLLSQTRFVIFVLLGFYLLDFALASARVVELSTLFVKNDYEKILIAHNGQTEHDKVLYGNSVLISAYIEARSAAGYVNFGMDYATLRDLRDMLKRGYLKPRQDLVLLLNYFVLLDSMDTNPTYPWHRKAYTPYVFFNRDRLRPVAEGIFQAALETGRLTLDTLPRHTDLSRAVYYGIMTDAELDARIAVHSERYWGLGAEAYRKNLEALREIIDYCQSENIRLRVAIAPWNSYIAMPENPKNATDAAAQICREAAVEVFDMTDLFPRKYFHDLGHLNYEYAAPRFTEEMEKWLKS